MPFLESLLKYLPLIQTGASIAGNVIGGRQQTGAIDRASGINQQATNDAMRMIMGMYDDGQQALSPYANVGPAALNNLQRLTNSGSVPAPASVRPTPTNSMARFAAPNPMLQGGGSSSVQNAMTTNSQGQSVNPSRQATNSSIRNSMIGTGVGLGAAAGIGGALAGSTALGALGGPIGMGLGAVGGLIGSQFGKNNPYKEAASRGIDQVSKNIWGTNTPGIPPEQLTSGYVSDILQGRTPLAEGKAKIEADLNAWVQGMRENGTPDSVIQSSIATQKQYLAPLRDLFARMGQQPTAA